MTIYGKWNSFKLIILNMASSGTKIEQEKVALVIHDIEDYLYDNKYNEIASQILLKYQCGYYDIAARIRCSNFIL